MEHIALPRNLLGYGGTHSQTHRNFPKYMSSHNHPFNPIIQNSHVIS